MGWRRWAALPLYLAVAGAATYVAFALLAYSRYRADFSPRNNNWLSDLGNRHLNPSGADYYVWGCTIAGVLVAAFFLSLVTWRRSGSRIQNVLLTGIQAAGGVAALGLVMSAVYTEDQFAQHQFWSRLIYMGFAMALFAAPFAFRRASNGQAVLVAIAIAGYASIVASLVFATAHWLEWPSIGMILAFVCWLGWLGFSRDRASVGTEHRGRVLGRRAA